MSASLRILVVDEDPKLRSRVRQGLDGLAGEIGEVGDGIEALKACERLRPDLVLVDHWAPRLGGLEVARALSKKDCPPVLLMGRLDEEEARAAGAAGVLVKPFDRATLRRRVREALEIRSEIR